MIPTSEHLDRSTAAALSQLTEETGDWWTLQFARQLGHLLLQARRPRHEPGAQAAKRIVLQRLVRERGLAPSVAAPVGLGLKALEDAPSVTGDGNVPLATADALACLAFWCRYSGYHAVAPVLLDIALIVWPPSGRSDRWARLSFRRALMDVRGNINATQAIDGELLARTFEYQIEHAGLARFTAFGDQIRADAAWHRGNLPKAEALASRNLEIARAQSLPDLEQNALGICAVTAGKRGDNIRAAQYSLALAEVDDPTSALRTMGILNLGVALMELRLYRAAIDCFSAVVTRERALGRRPPQMLANEAYSNLLRLFTLIGDRAGFESVRQLYSTSAVLPIGRVSAMRDTALGLARFGEVDAAAAILEEARALAAKFGFHQEWFSITEAVDSLRRQAEAEADPEALGTAGTALAAGAKRLRSVAERTATGRRWHGAGQGLQR